MCALGFVLMFFMIFCALKHGQQAHKALRFRFTGGSLVKVKKLFKKLYVKNSSLQHISFAVLLDEFFFILSVHDSTVWSLSFSALNGN